MGIVGVLGTGTIAAPMVRSLLRRFEQLSIVVSPRSKDTGATLAAQSSRVTVASSNQEVINAADTILLCMMADVARQVLPGLAFRPDHRLVTVMIDYSVEELLRDCYPVSHIELTMPLPFIDVGGCPLPCYPSGSIVAALFGDDNPITVLSESRDMQPYIAVAGVVSGFLQSVASIAQWLGGESGNEVTAEAHVLGLLSGYLNAIPKDGRQRLKEAMSDLSTEGGLNAQYRQALMDAGVNDVQKGQLDRLLERLNQ